MQTQKTLKEKILSYDQQVPRYTSYPTAPHLQPCDTDQPYQEALKKLSSNETISLYLHTPFCPKLCYYCGCNTKITQRYAPVEDYAHILKREIEHISDFLRNAHGHNMTVSHIHFGGGSPSMLRARDFELLMQALNENFDILNTAEIAMEIDPRNISEGRVATYAKYGMNRVSLGSQDFNQTTLKAVNREQPFFTNYKTVELLNQYGITDINLDLMYGLPHQTPLTIKDTIQKALLLNPTRIAFFGYAHVPWAKKHMRLIDEATLPNGSERYDLFETGREVLIDNGFVQIGIDHFAKPSDPLCKAFENKSLRRNFQGYTTDSTTTLIGLGASSISQFEDFYFQNNVDRASYERAITAQNFPIQKIYKKTKGDKIRAKIIEEIMCYGSCDLSRTDGLKTLFLSEEKKLETLQSQGFIILNRDSFSFKINPEAHMMTRLIASLFDDYFAPNTNEKKHARAI